MANRLPFNQGVPGSSPGWVTTLKYHKNPENTGFFLVFGKDKCKVVSCFLLLNRFSSDHLAVKVAVKKISPLHCGGGIFVTGTC